MSTGRIPTGERAATVLGLVVIGLSIALAAFVATIRRDLGPPEVVPRGVALGALYAMAGLVAVLGARRHRPGLITAAGIACLLGSFVSIATIALVVPAVLLIAIGMSRNGLAARGVGVVAIMTGLATGALVMFLILGAGVALLGLSEPRCWVATGTADNPVYEILAPGEPLGSVGGPDGSFASGCDSAALTTRGAAAETVMLAAAIWLAAGAPLRRPRRHDEDTAPSTPPQLA